MRRRVPAGERASAVWDAAGTARLLRAAGAVAANSRWTRDCVAARVAAARRAPVVYYGAPAVDAGAAPQGLPRRFVLCAARHAEYKGQDILLFAWSRLAASGLRLPLVLCGSDQSSGGLKRFADRLGVGALVRDLGQLDPGALQAVLRRAESVVLPSRRDSLGGILLEAMAAGRPIVASRVGGIPELVRHRREGLLVPPGRPAALARALRRVWTDAALRRRLGAGARRRSARFTWRAACAAWVRAAGARHGARVAVMVWEDAGDQTARAYLANAGAALRGLGLRPVLSAWDRRGPDAGALARLAATKPEFWVILLLRYRKVDVLTRFMKERGLRPVVHLC